MIGQATAWPYIHAISVPCLYVLYIKIIVNSHIQIVAYTNCRSSYRLAIFARYKRAIE